jgi:tetratricopeptide (TPR) repeat protein
MHALLRLTEHMAGPAEVTSSTVTAALDELARMGHVGEAIEHVDRLLRMLPPDAIHERSWLLEVGAEIAFDAGDIARMGRYLHAKLDLQPFFTRKCDKGCMERAVRQFRCFRGLLSPDEAADERERAEAAFRQHLRAANDAFRLGDLSTCAGRLRAAEGLVPSLEEVARGNATGRLLKAYADIGDRQSVRRLAEADRLAGRDVRVSPRDLLRAGERELAIARLRTEADEALEELRQGTVNAHFPAMSLERAIVGLVDAGDVEAARQLMERTLKEGESWHLTAPGVLNSAVFASVARAVARVQGSEAALALVKLAMDSAESDRKSDWRTAAIRSNAELLIALSPPEERAAISAKVRSPKSRARLLTKIAAEQHDWDRLHELLNAHRRPIDAAEAIWWMKFVWRPAQ